MNKKYSNLLTFILIPILTVIFGSKSFPGNPLDLLEAQKREENEKSRNLEEIRTLIQTGNSAEAENRARNFLPELKEIFGSESIEVADLLDLLVEAMLEVGKANLSETEIFAELALEIRGSQGSEEDPKLAGSLLNLADLFRRSGKILEALPLYRRALGIMEGSPKNEEPDLGPFLTGLGSSFLTLGNYQEARTYYERALEIKENNLGPDHPNLAPDLFNLAILLRRMGEFEGSKLRFERALELKEKEHGPDHIHIARILNGLGNLLEETGNYQEARQKYERALKIAEKELPPGNPFISSCLNNLGLLLRNTGDYAGARNHFEQVLNIQRNSLSPDHPYLAQSLNNLASLLTAMGDYSEANPLFEQALEIREKKLGPDHPEVATTHQYLADLLAKVGNLEAEQGFFFQRAKIHYQTALSIWGKSLGIDHPDNALALNGLAGLHFSAGEFSKAKLLYQRSLAIIEKSLGENHPETAQILSHLAELMLKAGELDRAEEQYDRVLEIQLQVLGPTHPLLPRTLLPLGRLLARKGESQRALGIALHAEKIRREHLRITALTLPERQALRYASVNQSGLDLAFSLALEDKKRNSVQDTLDALIRSRALVLNEMASRLRVAYGTENPEIIRLVEELTTASTQLTHIVVRGPDRHHPELYRVLFEEARQRKEKAARQLAEESLFYRRDLSSSDVGRIDVAEELSPGTALVSFSLFHKYDTRENGVSPMETVSSYLAFILLPEKINPVLVSLGSAEEIDDLVSRWKEKVAGGDLIKGWSPVAAEIAYRQVGDALRRKIWDPIAPSMKDVKKVFVVPDGSLHLVNFSALPIGESDYLIDMDPLIHFLSAERNIISPGRRKEESGTGLLAMGGPSFGDGSTVGLQASSPRQGNRSACGDFPSVLFRQLPHSAREIEEIVELWKGAMTGKQQSNSIESFTGPGATEAAFKKHAPGKRVLHLATHGFFLGGDCGSALPSIRGLGALRPAREAESYSFPGENPLLLSGLALAGANYRDAVEMGEEDGILTAEEIASLDLSGVEWAVLSACDTGVGEVKAGEGVFGLRRAFEMAGARTVIMSLWSVKDEVARDWMERLYRGRLLRGLGTAEAVHVAGRELLRQRRSKGASTHPFYWGAFVAAGDWR